MMYQWVDCLNIDTPRGVGRLSPREKVVLYDSDEELFFERLNRRNFDHVCLSGGAPAQLLQQVRGLCGSPLPPPAPAS